MAICLKCGKENVSCLCDDCRQKTDPEVLCQELLSYAPGSGENPLWEQVGDGLNNPGNLRYAVFAISDSLPSPRKEWMRVLAITGGAANIPKNSRPWFYDIYANIRDSDALTCEEKQRLKGIALGACYMDYGYEQAEEIAEALSDEENMPWQAYSVLAEYYITTRRYELADRVIAEAVRLYGQDPSVVQVLHSLSEKSERQRRKAAAGKQEYLPNPKENRDAVRMRYIDFLSSIGIEASRPVPAKVVPKPIPRDEYPKPVETRDTSFDTFVAFDLETTGINPKYDSIIEIGAVRVTGGEVVENVGFVFQELAKPFDRRLSRDVCELTGITENDLKDAREMWEVFTDFMEFVGDDVLVGFNCMIFDSRFMVRAGRYANIIVRNKYFDVMRYADRFRDQLNIEGGKISLQELSEKLEIKNPQAHRALGDAVTTARVFLKLKEIERAGSRQEDNRSVRDLLSDLDEW